MKLVKKLTLCTISFIVSTPVIASAASTSLDEEDQGSKEILLIKNGNFDDGLEDWLTFNSETNNPVIETEEDGNDYVQASYGENVLQYVKLKPETTYEFSYSVNGDAIVSFGMLNPGEKYISLKEEKYSTEEWQDRNFTFTTPEEENTYIIRFASSGNGTACFDNIQAKLVDLEKPTSPKKLTVTNVTDSSVSLKWGAATDNVGVTDYEIYRDGKKIGKTAGNKLTYTDTELSEDTTYTYVVKAKDAAENLSKVSNSVEVKTSVADRIAPSAPTKLQVKKVTSGSVAISWKAPTDDVEVTEYEVYREGKKIGKTTGKKLTYTDTKLDESTVYTYFVKAKDAAGNLSKASNSVEAKTSIADRKAPSTPTKLKTIKAAFDSVTLGWEASTDNVGVAGYEVYRDGKKVGETTEAKSYTDKDLVENTSYMYVVKAIDAEGNLSEASESVSMKTSAKHPESLNLSAPENLEIIDSNPDSVTIGWEDPSETKEADGYQVYRDGEEVGEAEKDESTYTDTEIKENADYTYSVKTVGKDGETSDFSEELPVTTEGRENSSSETEDSATTTTETQTEEAEKTVNSEEKETVSSTLPKTGSKSGMFLSICGSLMLGLSFLLIYHRKKQKNI